jgi:hypothetical protein
MMPKNLEWLWKGSRSDAKHPFLASLFAPLVVIIPVLPLMGGAHYLGSGAPLLILIPLGLSYVATFALLLPWFLVLSWAGVAGLVPVLLGSGLPTLLMVLVEDHETSVGIMPFYAITLGVGMIVIPVFWIIARGYVPAITRSLLQK